jgi:poly-gamma-glutamate synthesis protein (capsule biosynthesis protein)
MGWVAHPEFWQSILAVIRFEGWRLRKVELHPLDFGFKGPRTQRGRPLISGGKTGRDILAYLTKLSAPFGTKIEMGNGIGFIRLDDKY